MKSYNHLWEYFISDDNIEEAIRNAVKGKRKRRSVRKCLAEQAVATAKNWTLA